ncbi:hypothetical protein [Coleofasciculus sp. FACHB-1120]|uniref:hypothetical protein n=1 Tax=Coleofasciculus sp. FACHB-1120 TaxID=2692783 RepID=UPI00168293CB|nr:hypothetical protein [Coleofasciculus sp. FACHB-1120]MBD2741684.1 hypothetical protein [Coleofasciculus sp. FACHB-1120]
MSFQQANDKSRETEARELGLAIHSTNGWQTESQEYPPPAEEISILLDLGKERRSQRHQLSDRVP